MILLPFSGCPTSKHNAANLSSLHEVFQVGPLLGRSPPHQQLVEIDLLIFGVRLFGDIVHKAFGDQTEYGKDSESVRLLWQWIGCIWAARVDIELGEAVDSCLLGPDVAFRCFYVLLNESEQLLLTAAAHCRCTIDDATLLPYDIFKIIQTALILLHCIEK